MIEFIFSVMAVIVAAIEGSCIGILVVALVATIEILTEDPVLKDVIDCIIIAALILFGIFLL